MGKILLGLVFILGLFVLVSSSGSANQTPILPAQYLPGDTQIRAAYNSQLSPAIAQGGDKFLVAWEDSHAIVTGGSESETARDIYACAWMPMAISWTPRQSPSPPSLPPKRIQK
jgi:hypothetical protein